MADFLSSGDEDIDLDDDSEEKSEFEKLCERKGLIPAFTRIELNSLLVAELRIISAEWETNIRPRARKAEIIDALLADPSNTDPQWVHTFRLTGLLLPPYEKKHLKQFKTTDLTDVAFQWNIAGARLASRSGLIDRIMAHQLNINFRPPGYTHEFLAIDPDWKTDDEPPEVDDESEHESAAPPRRRAPARPGKWGRPKFVGSRRNPRFDPSRDELHRDDEDKSEHEDEDELKQNDSVPDSKFEALLRGFSTYKDIYKCNIKITGADDENLCMKVFDLQQYQRVTKCSWTSVYQHLITRGLEGIAKDRYRVQCMSDPTSVSAYGPLISFLFTQFPGDAFVEKLYRQLSNAKQGDKELKEYWFKYQALVAEYLQTINAVLEYQSNAVRTLIRPLEPKQIYVKFMSSLNDNSFDKLSSFIELKECRHTLSDIAPAIDSAQRVLYQKHGMRNRNKSTRKQSDGNRDRGRPKRKRDRGKGRGDKRKHDRDEPEDDSTKDRSRSRSRNKKRDKKKGKGRDRDRPQSRDDRLKKVKCFNCGEKGHYSNKCPKPKQTETPKSDGATTPKKNKKKNDKKKDKRHIDWISAPISHHGYRSDLLREELNNVDTSRTVQIPDKYTQSYQTRHYSNDNNCTPPNVKFNTSHQRRYIFALGTINTSNTNELDLSHPFTTDLRIKDYRSSKADGTYTGFLDTGSNTPAMRTDFVKKESFPIYAVKRPFSADTANGSVIIKYATILEIENVDNNNNKYWMKTIFYLFNDLNIDIIIDRRLMRLLGYQCNKLNAQKFDHKASTSNVLTNDDDIFWDKLINPDELTTLNDLNYDSYPEGDIDYDQDSIIPDKFTSEGNSMNEALIRSTFDTSNTSKFGGDKDWSEQKRP